MHAHDIRHSEQTPPEEGAFLFGLVLAALVLLVEIGGAVLGRSLALLADAGHIFADTLSLLLAYLAARQTRRMPTPEKSFGYHRATILAAFVNALALVVLSVALAIAAIGRLLHPVLPEPFWMGGSALIAFLLNSLVAGRLFPHRHGLSAQSVFLHYAGDAAASLGVAVAALFVWLGHLAFVDPLASLVIAGFIVRTSIPLIRQTVDILMEGTPRGIDPAAVREAILSAPGIRGVHDLHIWNLNEQQRVLTCHVLIEDMRVRESRELLQHLSERLAERFAIAHATFQVETPGSCADGDDCVFTVDTESRLRADSHRPGH